MLQRFLDRVPVYIRWFYTMFLVLIGWVLFNRTDFGQIAASLRQMFTLVPTDWVGAAAADSQEM